MTRFSRGSLVAAATAVLALAGVPNASAQDVLPPAQHTQVISANPLGLLFQAFNAEYERAFGSQSTLGVAGTYFSPGGLGYTSGDAIYRYYPQGSPLRGFALGGSLGFVNVSEDSGSGSFNAATLGVHVDYSWLLGAEQRFYVGVGIGAKRLFGNVNADDFSEDVSLVVPTIKLINVGYAF